MSASVRDELLDVLRLLHIKEEHSLDRQQLYNVLVLQGGAYDDVWLQAVELTSTGPIAVKHLLQMWEEVEVERRQEGRSFVGGMKKRAMEKHFENIYKVGLRMLDAPTFGDAEQEKDEKLLEELLQLVGIPPTQQLEFKEVLHVARMSVDNPGSDRTDYRRVARDLVKLIQQMEELADTNGPRVQRKHSGSINEEIDELQPLISGGALYRHWGRLIARRPMASGAAQQLSFLLRNYLALQQIKKESVGVASTPVAADTPHNHMFRTLASAKATRVSACESELCDLIACVVDASSAEESVLEKLVMDGEQLRHFFETSRCPDGTPAVVILLASRHGIALPRVLSLWRALIAHDSVKAGEYVADMHRQHLRDCSMNKHSKPSNVEVAATLRHMLRKATDHSESEDDSKSFAHKLGVFRIAMDKFSSQTPSPSNQKKRKRSASDNSNDFPPLVIENLSNQTVRHFPGSLKWNAVVLRQLDKVEVHILDPTSSVIIDRCVDCDIVIGPVKGVVALKDCHGCEVSVAASRLNIVECTDCSFFTYLKHRATISDSYGLRFSYWNVAYPFLQAQFDRCKFDEKMNRWDRVRDLTPDTNPENPHFFMASKAPELYSVLIPGVDKACENPLHRMQYEEEEEEEEEDGKEGTRLRQQEEETREEETREDAALVIDKLAAEGRAFQTVAALPDALPSGDPTLLQAKINIGTGLTAFLDYWHNTVLPLYKRTSGYRAARLLFLSATTVVMESKWATAEEAQRANAGMRKQIMLKRKTA